MCIRDRYYLVVDNKKIGHTGIMIKEKTAPKENHEKTAFMLFVYVVPEQRKFGYGQLMMELVFEELITKQKCNFAQLVVVVDNKRAINLYKKLGFAITKESQKLGISRSVSYTHLRAHETRHDLVCRLLLEKKKKIIYSITK
eukprot:TRINITY_DN3838_c0_g1_i7.p1 TRINITY_DN3838_c0_g1~~TRINITY_DN3838_c0_g1_i7.p1  ORF type:complete len:142 (-),score=29.69 TRINITY_DN3838_c0_g1_i7:34-459(-)